MSQFRIADNYTNALLNQPLSFADFDKIKEELEAFCQILKKHEYSEIFMSRVTDIAQKKHLIAKLGEHKALAETTVQLLHLLLENNRLNLLPKILIIFNERLHKEQGCLFAKVYSVAPLADDDLTLVRQLIAAKFPQQIIIENIIDQTVIGGAIIKIEDWVLDLSLNGALQNLERHIKTAYSY